jgi:hypothetical protein
VRRIAKNDYVLATMHRTPDYNEGLHPSQFVGSNRAWAHYEVWYELPESLKSDQRITAWRIIRLKIVCKTTYFVVLFTAMDICLTWTTWDLRITAKNKKRELKCTCVLRF